MSLTSQIKPNSLKKKIIELQKHRITPFIHCSKLNSVFKAIKMIMAQLSFYADEKKVFSYVEEKAAFKIINSIDQLQELFKQCSK